MMECWTSLSSSRVFVQKLEEKFNTNEEEKVQLQKTLKVIQLLPYFFIALCISIEVCFLAEFDIIAGEGRKRNTKTELLLQSSAATRLLQG